MTTSITKLALWVATGVIGTLLSAGAVWWASDIVYAGELKEALQPLYEQNQAQTAAVVELGDEIRRGNLQSERAGLQATYLQFRMIKMEVSDWTDRDQAELDQVRRDIEALDAKIAAMDNDGPVATETTGDNP